MEFGAVFPTVEIGDDPVAIRDWAQSAEALGYRFIVVFDHVLGVDHADRDPKLWGPYTQDHPFHEPFVLLGFMAAATTTIEFETGIIILPQRQTVLAAKQAAEVDVLSGGRLRLGLGTGWNHVEYEGLDVPWEGRGQRYDEQIDLMKQLWANDLVDFTGEFHRVERAGIAPRPATGSIPIWFGGWAKPALRRSARIGEGHYFAEGGRATHEQLAILREMLSAEGRDPMTYPVEFGANYAVGPDRWTKTVTRAKDAAVTHFSINTMTATNKWAGIDDSNPCETPAQHIEALETFMGSVT